MKQALLAFFFLLVCIPHGTEAQFSTDFGTGQSALTLVLNPAYPAPGEIVTATLDDYALGTSFSLIDWSYNNQVDINFRNNRTFRFVAPK
jgi:hypothetical protein